MELYKAVLEEIYIRDLGRRGALANLTDVQLFCLAYQLGIKV